MCFTHCIPIPTAAIGDPKHRRLSGNGYSDKACNNIACTPLRTISPHLNVSKRNLDQQKVDFDLILKVSRYMISISICGDDGEVRVVLTVTAVLCGWNDCAPAGGVRPYLHAI